MSGLSPQVAAIFTTPTSQLTFHKHHRRHHKATPLTPQSISSEESIDVDEDEIASQSKIGGIIALIGGFLLQLTLGSLFCYGNLVPYIASYMTYNDYMDAGQHLTDKELENVYNDNVSASNWVLFVIMLCMSSFIIFGGSLEVNIGPSKTLMIASALVTLGFGLTYFSLVYNSLILLIITYGIIFGCGVGIGYPVLVIVCMRWFPLKRGLICGIISAVFGCGAFVFDSIQTKLVNPHNLRINPLYGYVLQNDVISRIPFMFAYVSCIMFTMQIISIACIRSPPWFISQNKINDGEELQRAVSKSQLKYEAFSLTLKQTVSFGVYWELWINNFLYCIVLMFVTSEWKVFAMNYMKIRNDQLLSIIGSVASLCNGLGRFSWGIFYDFNKSFRISMGLQTTIITILLLTLPAIKFFADSQNTINILFSVWLFGIWFCVGCEYAFLPSCIAQTFGTKYTGPIVGSFVMSEAPATAIIVILTKYVFKNSETNWIYYCVTMAICTAISTILSILYKPNRIDRKKYLKESFKKMKKYNSTTTTATAKKTKNDLNNVTVQ